MDKTKILQTLYAQKVVFKEKFNISKIGLFGSYATNTNTVNSDLDLIFELKEGKHLGLKEMYDLEQFAQNLFQVAEIDLVNRRYLNPIIASEVDKTVIYV